MKQKRNFFAVVFVFIPVFGMAAETTNSKLNSGDTAWMIVATALVMLMTPTGLALFYGGMTRKKNILNTIGMSVMAYAITSVVWVLWAYSLSFNLDFSGIIGQLKLFLTGIKPSDLGQAVGNPASPTVLGPTIPTLLFVLFQLTFAAITVALISGAIIERLKFSTWLVFTVLWVTFVYAPVAHWVWGGGFLMSAGTLDFAGGIVVHVNAGIASLVLVLILGKRKDFGVVSIYPSSITLTTIGAMLLWFGWFGFNAGSQVAADGVAVNAFLITNTAGAMGAIAWMICEWMVSKRPTVLGIASGAIAGLATITPASGYVNLMGAFIIGLCAGVLGFVCVTYLKKALKYDDSLDAFGVHGIGGIFGSLAVGFFADPAINTAKGLFYGNPVQAWIQLKAVLITIVYSGVVTAIVYYVSAFLTKGGRVKDDVERVGLDEAVHGEKGFYL